MIFPGQPPVGYHELADILREQITSGQIRPGQRLPSELTLAQTYGVAGKTARAALIQLRQEGIATVVRGYGVVVREPVEPEVIVAEPGSTVTSRPPTPQERETYAPAEGWPLLIVTSPDGLQDLYPADRTVVRVPADRPTE
ncbi:GntR family transcriptional regulator [Micromonospora rosaria]|uniref:GntR family transcriptional regulator n=1 Tax=Micromonospora rosaria TaxID=47874 RepID=UPI00082A268F|nr:GntR family transcriptional regulator [Micromonospora rosaria]